MNTSKITTLCNVSDHIFEKKKKAEKMLENMNEVNSLRINCPYGDVTVSFDSYPELKPLAEKLLKYIVKSEETKQMEIKMEIAKCL